MRNTMKNPILKNAPMEQPRRRDRIWPAGLSLLFLLSSLPILLPPRAFGAEGPASKAGSQAGAGVSQAGAGRLGPAELRKLEKRVLAYLEKERDSWDYWNVPFGDGKILHDLAVRIKARRLLEIGTSTGHSALWLGLAAAKTGGRLVTIEIDSGRHARALAHLKAAGLSGYVDARLADAHDLVKTLPGPWDFVFSDADKEWYLQYFLDLDPKMAEGGCFTAHNVLRPMAKEVEDFVTEIKRNKRYRTRFEKGESGEGISVSCRVD